MTDDRRVRAIARMEALTSYYAAQRGVLGVAAFGSNAERERFDAYSDLDFLVLAEPAAMDKLLQETPLLYQIHPIAGLATNAEHTVKLLFQDGVLCDYGIIAPERVAAFCHGEGRYLWRREGWNAVDLSAREPVRKTPEELETDALFHLYVGLLRAKRGEEAAAFYEIQVAAAQDVLALLGGADTDVFSPVRQIEKTVSADVLGSIFPGYRRSVTAAKGMLGFMEHLRGTPLFETVFALLN